MSTVDRISLEKAWAELNAHRVIPENIATWNRCRHASRIMLFEDRELVLWDWFMGKPRNLARLFVSDVAASFAAGFEALLVTDTGEGVWISCAPQQLLGRDIFVWLPHFQDLGWTPNPKTGEFTLRLSVVIRSKSAPDRPEEGAVNLTDVQTYNNLAG